MSEALRAVIACYEVTHGNHACYPQRCPRCLSRCREQRDWLEQAVSRIDEGHMAFNCAMTSIHSPTGEERAASEWMVQQMRAASG